MSQNVVLQVTEHKLLKIWFCIIVSKLKTYYYYYVSFKKLPYVNKDQVKYHRLDKTQVQRRGLRS